MFTESQTGNMLYYQSHKEHDSFTGKHLLQSLIRNMIHLQNQSQGTLFLYGTTDNKHDSFPVTDNEGDPFLQEGSRRESSPRLQLLQLTAPLSSVVPRES